MRAPRSARPLALLWLALWLNACGNVTVGGFGDVTVAVSGDEPDPAPQPAPQMALASPTPQQERAAPLASPLLTSHQVEGHVELDFMLFLVSETGSTLRLGEDLIEVRVDVRGEADIEAVDRQLVTATRYDEMQIVFTDIRAEVEGLVIDGILVPEVRVELDDVSLLVVRPLDLDVAPGESVTLTIELNSLAWLQAVDPILGTVDEMVFASLIDLVIG
jgi:hypothetical protein